MTAVSTRGDWSPKVSVVTGRLAWRSISLLPRVPATFIPSLVFPLVQVVAFSGAFSAVARVPGFPAKAMVDWILPMAVVQGAAFAGVTAGFAMARDMEGGFFDRLRLAPVRHSALVFGPMMAAVMRALIPSLLVLVAGLLAGAHLTGGVLGLVALLVAAEGAALLASAWAIGVALRFGSIRAAPLMQVGMFLAVFLSTAQVPLSLMTSWLHAVARVNPTTNILALGRQGFIGHVTWTGTWPGLVALGGGALVLGTFALRGLRRIAP